MIRFQATFRLSLAPPFTEPQIAYLEDLLANKLMGIVAHSRCGHECAACFGVIDGVLALVRNLRQQRSQ